MLRLRPLFPFVFAAAVGACSSDPVGAPDGGATLGDAAGVDASEPADASRLDAAVVRDASAADAASADAAPEDALPSADAAPLDAAPLDAAPLDASAGDSGVACMLLDLDVYIVRCPSGLEYARHFLDPNNPAPLCPDYVQLLGQSYADLPAAITGAGCDAQCVYQASISVSFIDHCGHRNGYIVFAAPGCADVYEFSSGLFPSVMAWEEATSCGG